MLRPSFRSKSKTRSKHPCINEDCCKARSFLVIKKGQSEVILEKILQALVVIAVQHFHG
jgi:hypothetical protein